MVYIMVYTMVYTMIYMDGPVYTMVLYLNGMYHNTKHCMLYTQVYTILHTTVYTTVYTKRSMSTKRQTTTKMLMVPKNR